MPEQDLHATQAHHAEEVLDVVLPTDDQPTKVMQPGKESFHSPTPAVPPQRATVLCGFAALSAMGCDHLDAIALGQISIQAVTVVGFVADPTTIYETGSNRECHWLRGSNTTKVRQRTRYC